MRLQAAAPTYVRLITNRPTQDGRCRPIGVRPRLVRHTRSHTPSVLARSKHSIATMQGQQTIWQATMCQTLPACGACVCEWC
eukprot:351665-Chlamydomonas_euryale.AAC.7